MTNNFEKLVQMPIDSIVLEGILVIPQKTRAIIVFAHGSGSSRHSPRNNYVAKVLQEAGFGTLLFDLLTEKEDENYEKRFEIPLLSQRLELVTAWLKTQKETNNLKIGYFGASTGSAAALEAASNLNLNIFAVVSRGGRPDIARKELASKVKAPVLMIVGGEDKDVIELNKQASKNINALQEISIVPKATHLFEEEGALEKAAFLARDWFIKHLT